MSLTKASAAKSNIIRCTKPQAVHASTQKELACWVSRRIRSTAKKLPLQASGSIITRYSRTRRWMRSMNGRIDVNARMKSAFMAHFCAAAKIAAARKNSCNDYAHCIIFFSVIYWPAYFWVGPARFSLWWRFLTRSVNGKIDH